MQFVFSVSQQFQSFFTSLQIFDFNSNIKAKCNLTIRFASLIISFEFRKCKIRFQLNENKVAVGVKLITSNVHSKIYSTNAWTSYWNLSEEVWASTLLLQFIFGDIQHNWLELPLFVLFSFNVFIFRKEASYEKDDRVVCRMELDNHWHRGKIINVERTDAGSAYLVTFDFHRDDKNRWANANELLDDAICGDTRNGTIGYGIIFLDRRSYRGFGEMKSAEMKRLIIVRQCTICQQFFRFVDTHEKQKHGLKKREKAQKVRFSDTIQVRMIPNFCDDI